MNELLGSEANNLGDATTSMLNEDNELKIESSIGNPTEPPEQETGLDAPIKNNLDDEEFKI